MSSRQGYRALILLLIALLMAGCGGSPTATDIPLPAATPPASPVPPTPTTQPTPPAVDLSAFAFPASIDSTQKYLFYLHGKIIEDQGLPAVSPDYGEYEYLAILEKLASYGFVVISEQRGKNTESLAYAQRVAEQVTTLLDSGVPAGNITVVGASKGAWITVYISNLLKNEAVNFVIMAICHPDNVADFKRDEVLLYGNVLSIYDSSDEYAGSCQELFLLSAGKGLSNYNEILLKVGTGHGILYQPLDEWILPVVEWAGKP